MKARSFMRSAGVLRYNRESDNLRLNLMPFLSEMEDPAECLTRCEYCGERASTFLDQTQMPDLEATQEFCCTQRRWLCGMLEKQNFLFEAGFNRARSAPTSDKDISKQDMLRLLGKSRKMEEHSQMVVELQHGQQKQPGVRFNRKGHGQYGTDRAAKTLQFKLGKPRRTVSSSALHSAAGKLLLEEKSLPCCGRKPTEFGLCDHQSAGLKQEDYPSGRKFLTAFPDGSAQIFYPSGLLALVVVVTEQNGRVCIVFDDIETPHQPIKAMFQSNGRANCYHNNGNIWLALNKSGGLCLSDTGARMCQWSWGSAKSTPSPIHPIFFPLNKTVGVRVLGSQKVFVSFLASGRQAKFSVGFCCVKARLKAKGSSSFRREEPSVLAAKIRVNLAFQRLHQCLMAASGRRLIQIKLIPQHRAAAQRLLEDRANVKMTESERAFIHKCLEDY